MSGISINDLRKNLRDLNDHMDQECRSSAARYGVTLDASLITEIDPPPEVESALAAINTAHNHVSSEISLAHAGADQKIVQSKRAVEIETLKAQGEVEPLVRLAEQLSDLKRNGPARAAGLSAQRPARPLQPGARRDSGGRAMIDAIMEFLPAALITFGVMFVLMPVLLFLVRVIGLYTIVFERTCHVYMLFGKVVGTIDEPGLHILPFRLGLAAFLVNWIGQRHVLDMRLDQEYLRSQPVNSEEGAPMGIGMWYEMYISDPVAFLFKNTDPRGSLRANVSNATVRCLSNMRLADMLETRHTMSQAVRAEVSDKSHDWGYRLGSVYIRKVHFRDGDMIRQIEEKVVNRLRQVTSAIRQDGANQVSIITNTAERTAAVEFAKAAAMRPQIVGAALNRISEDPEIEAALFEVLENQKLLEGEARITLVPRGSDLLAQMLAMSLAVSSKGGRRDPPPAAS